MERISRVRAVALLLLFCLVISLFAGKLFSLQIIETKGDTDNTTVYTTVTTVRASRGDILDWENAGAAPLYWDWPVVLRVYDAQADLAAIAPDFPALSKLSERYEVVGVHAFTLDGEGDAVKTTCHVRNFAPLYDIDEEAATGTSNGALTYYGYLNGFVADGDDCRFVQGEAMK